MQKDKKDIANNHKSVIVFISPTRQHKPNQTNKMTTQSQLAAMLKFAQLHDWGTRASIPMHSESLHVWDSYSNQIMIFSDMQSLKAWAGY